jgi:hypothetical protein
VERHWDENLDVWVQKEPDPPRGPGRCSHEDRYWSKMWQVWICDHCRHLEWPGRARLEAKYPELYDAVRDLLFSVDDAGTREPI